MKNERIVIPGDYVNNLKGEPIAVIVDTENLKALPIIQPPKNFAEIVFDNEAEIKKADDDLILYGNAFVVITVGDDGKKIYRRIKPTRIVILPEER